MFSQIFVLKTLKHLIILSEFFILILFSKNRKCSMITSYFYNYYMIILTLTHWLCVCAGLCEETWSWFDVVCVWSG